MSSFPLRSCMVIPVLLLLLLSGSVSGLSITWCVYRPADITKCDELAIAYGQSSSANNRLEITCEDFTNKGDAEACWARVLADTQTITVIDAPEIYKALRAGTEENSIRVALAEDYDGTEQLVRGSLIHDYWVGVVLGGRSDLKVTELKNKRICLPGYDTQGAWETPLGYFAWRGWFDPSERCNPLWTVTRYFGNSCLPDQSSSIPDHWRICAACSQGTCSAEGQFSGQSGALRCITSGAGDVAFVHLKAALSLYDTDEGTSAKLLCRDNSQSPIDGWLECNFGSVRTAGLAYNSNMLADDVSTLQRLISNPPVNVQDIIFETSKYSNSEKKVIFSGEITSLAVLQSETQRDPEVYLGREYVTHKDALHCVKSTGVRMAAGTLLILVSILFLNM